MKAKKLQRDLFIILVSSFVVILFWIGFNIYNAAVSSTIDETLAEQIIPIVPSFDMVTVNRLKQRKQISAIYELATTASSEADITPTPSPTIPRFDDEEEEEPEEVDEDSSPSIVPTVRPTASIEDTFDEEIDDDFSSDEGDSIE